MFPNKPSLLTVIEVHLPCPRHCPACSAYCNTQLILTSTVFVTLWRLLTSTAA